MNRLKEVLEKKKIDQSELARKMGLSRQIISVWCLNVGDPSLENIRKLCNVIGVSADEIIGINLKKE